MAAMKPEASCANQIWAEGNAIVMYDFAQDCFHARHKDTLVTISQKPEGEVHMRYMGYPCYPLTAIPELAAEVAKAGA